MLKTPRIKDCYNIGLMDNERAILVAENSEKIVEGKLLCNLLEAMGNGRSSDELAEELSDSFGLTEVYYGIAELERLGLAVEADGLDSSESVFWGLMGMASAEASDRLATARVAAASLNGEAGELVRLLRLNGLSGAVQAMLAQQDLDNSDLTVVIADDYLEPELDEFNRLALEKGHKWLLCKPTGVKPWVGPLFIPGETGCWHCLADRIRYNREVLEFIRFKKGEYSRPIFPLGATNSSKGIAENLLAMELARLITNQDTQGLAGKILTLDCKTMELTAHRLVRRPQCPVCGNESDQETKHPEPPSLVSRTKSYRLDGGHRIFSPEVTLDLYSKHISQITGVVGPITLMQAQPLKELPGGLDSLLRVYGAAHASVGKVTRLEDVKKGLRSGSSAGKGLTDIQARTSCLCEAIERVSGIFRGDEYRIRAAYDQVKDRAFHPHELLQYSEKQYREQDKWNSMNCAFTSVPIPFDGSWEIDWTPIWSLSNKTWKLVPAAFCYYGYPKDEEKMFCTADSNGNAAGNCIEEAVLQGLLELIERDAVALWWYNMLTVPEVDLETMNDPAIAQFVEGFSALGRKVWVLDITSDLGVPVFAALSSMLEGEQDRPIFGFGSHLDPKIAFTRALSEMTQALGLTEFPPEFLEVDEKYTLHMKFTEETILAETPYLVPATNVPKRSLAEYPDRSTDDLLEDVNLCMDLFAEKGLEVLVLDQTRSDLGLSVVKVVVPGIRHFWARYAPGRLYDVPVEMGWLDEPTAEENLNPTPIFF
ncbi:TOMM precursor leader peptide-binding protein [Thermodesulfobacteriota bacterium]